jgi:hypothetical protein
MVGQPEVGRGIHSGGSLPTHPTSLARPLHAQPLDRCCRVRPRMGPSRVGAPTSSD